MKSPSRRRLGWLAGLPVLALLWAGATSLTAPYLADAMTRAGAAIARDTGEGVPEPWLRIEVSGRDVVAMGEAPGADRRDAALTRLAAIPGLRRIVDRTGTIELASPFVWKATVVDGGQIELTGSRPAEIGVSALAAELARAVASDAKLRDRARAARGAPPEFAAGASYALERLRGMKPGAAAILTDTVLSFEGEAGNVAAYDTIREAVAAPPQGFSLGTVAILPPLVEDFRFVVERRLDGRTLLDGHVVSEAARAAIRSGAGESDAGSAVEDRMQTARGLPSSIDPSELARFVVRLSGLIQDGNVRFEHGVVSASGVAVDGQAVGEIAALVRDERPSGAGAGSVMVTARPVSPYRLRIRREADSIVLSGHLPDPTARDAVVSALRRVVFREAVVDRTRISDGAPQDLVAAVSAAFGPFSTLASAEIAVSDRALTLTGESLYPQNARRLGEADLRAMPKGWTATVSVGSPETARPLAAAVCLSMFVERTSARPLRFAVGSSELKPEFYPVLDAVAELAKSCPSQRMEVTGHADPAGTPAARPKPLPEYTSSVKEPQDKRAKVGKDAAKNGGAGKATTAKGVSPPGPGKTEAKASAPIEEPVPDLSEQRALAIVDYLQKAGVAADRVTTVPMRAGVPDDHRIGLLLRS